ncbi:MAG: hypothetical protein DMF74_10645 [Acidobacteria bacterium]|nr:MAG: hypothetical protein DMF74_10645 [Acidobacteriota bacterium]
MFGAGSQRWRAPRSSKSLAWRKHFFEMNKREQNQSGRFLNSRGSGKRTQLPGFELLIRKDAEGVTK